MSTPDLTISRVLARPVIAPMARPVRTAVGDVLSAPLVLIDVETREGVVGRAYIFAYTQTALAALHRLVIDIGAGLVGETVAPVEQMRRSDRRFRLLGWQGLVGMAVGGLDMALWDALGQAAGMSVARLLGGSERHIRAYDSFGLVDHTDDAAAIAASVAAGFGAIKIKLGEGTLAGDVAVVAAVREIIGPDCLLMVDFNQAFRPTEAVARIRALAKFGIHWFEEPVAAEDVRGHARVHTETGAPIQSGENWWHPAGIATGLSVGACDHVMPDLMKVGGVTGWMAAAALAQAESVPVSSHIFPEASAHVLAVTPTAHLLEWLDLAHAILAEPQAVVAGHVTPRGPGLGMAWNEAAVARYRAE